MQELKPWLKLKYRSRVSSYFQKEEISEIEQR